MFNLKNMNFNENRPKLHDKFKVKKSRNKSTNIFSYYLTNSKYVRLYHFNIN